MRNVLLAITVAVGAVSCRPVAQTEGPRPGTGRAEPAAPVSTPAQSQPKLKVFADTPLRAALIEIGEAFRRDSGQQIDFFFDASPAIRQKLADGEVADVLIAQPGHIAELIKSGKLVPGEYPEIGRVGLGLAIRSDAPAQSIATVDEFRQVLLKADTLVTNTVVSGDQFVATLEKLQMPEAVKNKVVRLPRGVYERVIQGKGNDIGAGVVTIIKETKGVRLLGPLPAEIQSYQAYAAAPMTAAASPETARRFIAYLARPPAKASFSASGVEAADAPRTTRHGRARSLMASASGGRS